MSENQGPLLNVSVGDTHEINIKVTGNIDSLKVASCNSCVVNGSVGSLESKTSNGVWGVAPRF